MSLALQLRRSSLIFRVFISLCLLFTSLCSSQLAAQEGNSKSSGLIPKPSTSTEKLVTTPFDTFNRPSLITQAAALVVLGLLPFIVMLLTSFLKVSIVLSLLRNAVGVQQAPPSQIINSISIMLSLFIMYPTMLDMWNAGQAAVADLRAPDSLVSSDSSLYVIKVADGAKEPLGKFLIRNSLPQHRHLFYRIAYRSLPENIRETLTPENFIILVPSYVTSQLKEAFEIGVLIYVPFFVIDLVTSNILLAMGMMMLSPVTISLPLKLFLLVMLDGWTLLIEGLVKTFR